MRAILSLLILSQVACAAGERELMAVLSARVRWSLVPQMNDEPPDIKNRLLSGTARDLAEAQHYIACLEAERNDERREKLNAFAQAAAAEAESKKLRAALQAAETLTQDASHEGNGVEPSRQQPSVEWNRPPVLSRIIQWGPGWCGVCKSCDADVSPKLKGKFNYEYRTGDETEFPKEVLTFAEKHNAWPVWQIELKDGSFIFTNKSKTAAELVELHETGKLTPRPVMTIQPQATTYWQPIPFRTRRGR